MAMFVTRKSLIVRLIANYIIEQQTQVDIVILIKMFVFVYIVEVSFHP